MPIPETLLELHRRLGARLEADGSRVIVYSDPEREYWALREGCGLYERSAHGLLRLTGAERHDFVQRMVTNDVVRLAEGRAVYAALLNTQGKMLADLRLLKRPGELLADLLPGLAESVAAWFDRYIISEDVQVEDVSAKWALHSFIGPRAHLALGSALEGGCEPLAEGQLRELEGGEVLLVGTRMGALPGVDLFASPERARGLAEAALELFPELVPVGFEALEIARIEAGQPRFGQDMTEETLPLEAGLERAISYDKGCYLGQEVIARATYRGMVRRKLAGLVFDDGELPEPGLQLFKDGVEGKAAAEVTSAARSPNLGVIALGFVRREHLAPETELATADGRKARVRALPFELAEVPKG